MWWKKLLFRFSKDVSEDGGHGHIEIIPEPDDFLLGAQEQALKTILSRKHDYTSYLPQFETQNDPYEVWSCVSFSAVNCLEIIYKTQYGKEVNYSDRFIASLSDTIPQKGNNFKRVADTIRHAGMVLEEAYPWEGRNVYEYLKKPKESVKEKGKAWLQIFEVQYEWVDWAGVDPNKLYEALLYGPVQVSANASALRARRRWSLAPNHAVVVVKGVKGKSFTIFDTYKGNEKYDVPWNFYFGSAMRYSLIKKNFIPLVKVWDKPPVYAIFGAVASHILDESSWHYGESIGMWDTKIKLITQENFNKTYTVGRSIKFL